MTQIQCPKILKNAFTAAAIVIATPLAGNLLGNFIPKNEGEHSAAIDKHTAEGETILRFENNMHPINVTNPTVLDGFIDLYIGAIFNDPSRQGQGANEFKVALGATRTPAAINQLAGPQ